MNEEELLDEIFSEKKWKDKYFVEWCDLCDTAIIVCKDCKNSSCNGGGCNSCINDFNEFNSCKTKIHEYLSDEEIQIYEKCLRLKKHIIESLNCGEKEINWKQRLADGKFSKNEEEMFKKELSKSFNDLYNRKNKTRLYSVVDDGINCPICGEKQNHCHIGSSCSNRECEGQWVDGSARLTVEQAEKFKSIILEY